MDDSITTTTETTETVTTPTLEDQVSTLKASLLTAQTQIVKTSSDIALLQNDNEAKGEQILNLQSDLLAAESKLSKLGDYSTISERIAATEELLEKYGIRPLQ